ncbi:ATP-binding cassette domain-containing protein [Clostridium sp. HBUAS56017]|uniref:ABC transporter ATP-binding protein n=1 Tax=Clostridium sp. HBUAS56017 TaxID=2571128 RepID=UPI001177B7A6|nr:ATP-binding cassette domain-containing protein [Clostridium sp. HBUAS56017]
MIEVNNLSKEFKINKKYEGLGGTFKSFFSREYTIKKAVDNLSFYVEKGEILGYIGLNGAGKSTTIKMLSGLLVPTSGECKVNGIIPYNERKTYTKNIGVVFGNRSQLWWDLPVSESFSVLKKIYETPEKEFWKRLEYLKEVLDLNEFYLTPVRNLSLGQKMRADLAAAILHNPEVLFLDEPTIGLDIFVKEKIRQAIKQINRETNTTVLLTTHDLDDIEKICNKIIVIDKGKKIFDGNIDELKKKYGKTRTVYVDLDGTVDNDTEFELDMDKKYITISKDDNGKVKISFDKDHVNLLDLIHHVGSHNTVKDFTVMEPQLEEIVKMIYGNRDGGKI